MPTSKRFEALSKRPVNMDGFVTEWPEAGIVAMESPYDPVSSIRLENGVIVEMDGKRREDFDFIDTFIADYAIDHAAAEEAAALADGWAHCGDEAFQKRLRLLNPLAYIRDARGKKAAHYRIRVGADDADTAFSVSMTLAVMLQNANLGTVDDALVWRQPHCEADVPGQIQDWIHHIFEGQGA